MNIGMVLDLVFPPDIRVENEADSLIQAGHNVFILCFSKKLLDKPVQIFKNITLIRIYLPRFVNKNLRALINTFLNLYPYFWAKHINKFISKYNIDVLHIHDLYMFKAGFIAMEKVRKKIPIVGDLHENYVDALAHYRFSSTFPGNLLISIPKWEKIEIQWCLKTDYLITVIDEAVERYHSLGIPKEKITVVANYVNQETFLNTNDNLKILKEFQDKFVLTYIGGFDIHRGIESLVKAMPKVIKKCPNIKLVLVGSGKNLDKLIKLSYNLKVDNYISFEGWQAPSNLPSYIKTSSVCLIPHLKTVHTDNTIPHKLFQYMLLEKPVVATNCNPIERIINETECGLVYESNNEHLLTNCILKLYKNSELREQMGENGKKAVFEKYNWGNTSKNLVNLYKQIEKEY